MSEAAHPHLTEDEFFEFLQGREEKWELIDGQPVMMAGANQRHQAIAMNIAGSLFSQLRGTGCRPTTADTGVATSGGNVRYPDVVVNCGRRIDEAMLATTPTVIVEVLSPSTRSFDTQRKLFEYKANPDVRCILLIDTDNACTFLHRREGQGWVETFYNGFDDVIALPEVDASLALQDIYDGVEFKPRLVISPVCQNCEATPCVCGSGSGFTR